MDLVSQVVPDNQLIPYVEQLAKELGSRNGATLESAKIAAYMEKDLDFDTALRTDDLVSHRMRYYTNPLSDVEGYLHSQKGGGSTGYAKPEDRKNDSARSWEESDASLREHDTEAMLRLPALSP